MTVFATSRQTTRWVLLQRSSIRFLLEDQFNKLLNYKSLVNFKLYWTALNSPVESGLQYFLKHFVLRRLSSQNPWPPSPLLPCRNLTCKKHNFFLPEIIAINMLKVIYRNRQLSFTFLQVWYFFVKWKNMFWVKKGVSF